MIGKIGIIGAMDLEIAALAEKVENKKTEEFAGIVFTTGVLAGCDAVLAVCGIGKVSAAMCAQAMILKFAPDAVINVGVAGTLTPRLGIGDVALATAAVCHDMDTTPLGDPRGWISGLDLVEIPVDGELSALLEAACRAEGINVLRGVIASGDRFVVDPEEKADIRSTFNAVACEMEGQAICQVCYANRVPCAVLRSISDSIDGGAMDYEQFKHLAAAATARVLMTALRALRA